MHWPGRLEGSKMTKMQRPRDWESQAGTGIAQQGYFQARGPVWGQVGLSESPGVHAAGTNLSMHFWLKVVQSYQSGMCPWEATGTDYSIP